MLGEVAIVAFSLIGLSWASKYRYKFFSNNMGAVVICQVHHLEDVNHRTGAADDAMIIISVETSFEGRLYLARFDDVLAVMSGRERQLRAG